MGKNNEKGNEQKNNEIVKVTTIKDKLFLAVLTALLTCICSAFVVRYELSKGHQIWQLQDTINRQREIYGLKVRLVEKLTILASKLGGLNDRMGLNTFFATVALAADDYDKFDMSKLIGDISMEQKKVYSEHMEVFAEMQSQLLLTKMLFGKDVKEAADKLIYYFAEKKTSHTKSNEVYAKVIEAYKKDMNMRETLNSLQKSFLENLPDARYQTSVRDLLSAMSNELSQTSGGKPM